MEGKWEGNLDINIKFIQVHWLIQYERILSWNYVVLCISDPYCDGMLEDIDVTNHVNHFNGSFSL